MDLKLWRAQQVREGQLPCGLDVKYRAVDLMTLIANGDLPADTVNALQDMERSGGKVEIQATELPMYVEIFNAVAEAVLVDPPVGSGEDELNVTELPLTDRTELFLWVKQGAADLAASFREAPGEDGEKPVEGA